MGPSVEVSDIRRPAHTSMYLVVTPGVTVDSCPHHHHSSPRLTHSSTPSTLAFFLTLSTSFIPASPTAQALLTHSTQGSTLAFA